MKPSELYKLAPQKVDFDIGGINHRHLPEIDEMSLPWEDPNRRVENRSIKYFNFDGRRFWELAAIWFDGNPIMVTQNAGREGDDHSARFITNPEGYRQMISYLRSLTKTNEDNHDVVNVEDDIPDLTSFYGNSLDGEFHHYRY